MSLGNIPEYPESRHLMLEDRNDIEEFFSRYPTEISERTFGSVYIWRRYAGRSLISQHHGHLIVSWYRERFGRLMFCPVGDDPVSVIREFTEPPLSGTHEFDGVFAIAASASSALRIMGLDPTPLREDV